MAFNWFKKKTKQPEKEVADIACDENDMIDETVEIQQVDEAQQKTVTLPVGKISDGEEIDTDIAEEQEATAAVDAAEGEKDMPRKGFFSRLKNGLSKTRNILTTDIEDIFSGKQGVDDDMLEELEELLITSDMGVLTAMDLMGKIEKKASKISGARELQQTIKAEIIQLFDQLPPMSEPAPKKPHVVMVIGVNGVGKTTTIGKLAAKATQSGQKVLIAAADTFRAAAIEQLTIWAERSGADIVKHKANADPAAVAFDSMEAALARGVDTVFVDTAGRLHTKVNLMEELKKIQRTITKKIPDAPHEILLVLDATTGQNALSQAKLFNEAIGITGLALTKLDGTAKGGIVISICTSLNLPLKYIGVGESIEDLQDFDARQFAEALL
jgi:fused signal recognition particle receptor